MRHEREVDVLVVGAGPAGLAAAEQLARAGAVVEVLEREHEAGGVPRHSHHPGYGLRDLHRSMSGPAYARAWTRRAGTAGAAVRTGVSATGWAGPLALDTTSPAGLERLAARAVVLATGARERPRAARWVPGSRPRGVWTTGQLQQAVYLEHLDVGTRAVVVGAEHVGYSAALTLAHARVEVAALLTEHATVQTYRAFAWGARLRYAFPVLTSTRVTALHGRARLEAVEVRHADGRTARIAADTVVFTGDWVPDHELARAAGLAMDAASKAPLVDPGLRTSAPGVFAAGNLVHPVHTADVVALAGRHVAGSVLEHLRGVPASAATVPVVAAAPLRWVVPALVGPRAPEPPRGRFTAWSGAVVRGPVSLVVRQDDHVLHRQRRPLGVLPGRPLDLPAGWRTEVHTGCGPVSIGVESR